MARATTADPVVDQPTPVAAPTSASPAQTKTTYCECQVCLWGGQLPHPGPKVCPMCRNDNTAKMLVVVD